MAQIYRIVSQSSWALGLASLLAAVIVRLFHLSPRLNIETRTFFILSCTLFLCALATRAIERT